MSGPNKIALGSLVVAVALTVALVIVQPEDVPESIGTKTSAVQATDPQPTPTSFSSEEEEQSQKEEHRQRREELQSQLQEQEARLFDLEWEARRAHWSLKMQLRQEAVLEGPEASVLFHHVANVVNAPDPPEAPEILKDYLSEVGLAGLHDLGWELHRRVIALFITTTSSETQLRSALRGIDQVISDASKLGFPRVMGPATRLRDKVVAKITELSGPDATQSEVRSEENTLSLDELHAMLKEGEAKRAEMQWKLDSANWQMSRIREHAALDGAREQDEFIFSKLEGLELPKAQKNLQDLLADIGLVRMEGPSWNLYLRLIDIVTPFITSEEQLSFVLAGIEEVVAESKSQGLDAVTGPAERLRQRLKETFKRE